MKLQLWSHTRYTALQRWWHTSQFPCTLTASYSMPVPAERAVSHCTVPNVDNTVQHGMKCGQSQTLSCRSLISDSLQVHQGLCIKDIGCFLFTRILLAGSYQPVPVAGLTPLHMHLGEACADQCKQEVPYNPTGDQCDTAKLWKWLLLATLFVLCCGHCWRQPAGQVDCKVGKLQSQCCSAAAWHRAVAAPNTAVTVQPEQQAEFSQ